MYMTWNYDPAHSSGSYTLTDATRTKYIFTEATKNNNTYGQDLTQITDRNGNSIYLQYVAGLSLAQADLLISITTGSGGTGTTLLSLTRSGSLGFVLSATDCYGRSVYYTEPTNLELATVSQIVPTGTASPPNRWAYTYMIVSTTSGDAKYLKTISVPSPTGSGASTVTFNYAAPTYAISSIEDGNGNTRNYTYSTPGANQTTVTVKNSLGNTVYSYVGSYDANMSGTGSTDGNGTTLYTETFSDPNDPYRPSSVTDANGHTTSYVWDANANLHKETSPRGTVTNYSWGFPTGYVPTVVNSSLKTTAFQLGELLAVQEGTKTATSISYNEPSGTVSQVTSPTPGTVGSASTVTTSLTYDSLGNVLTTTQPANASSGTITTTYNYTTDSSYDASGNPGSYSQSAAIGQPLTVTDQLGRVTHLRYNARGDNTIMVDANTSPGNKTTASYNLDDRPLTITYPATGQSGSGNSTLTYAYRYSISSTDQYGPLYSQTNANESATQVAQTYYGYGPEGETLSVAGSADPVTYAYDALYRLSALTDGGSNATRYYYNSAGYLDTVTYPGYTGPTPVYSGGTWGNVTGADSQRYPSYDGIGDVTSRVDGRNVTTTYTYSDPESLLTKIHYALPASPPSTLTALADTNYTYDSYGRRATMSDATGTHTYGYDDLDVLTGEQTSYTALASATHPSTTVQYGYWPGGARSTMSYGYYTLASPGTPAGTFNYTYGADGRPHAVVNQYNESVSWSYGVNGWLSQQILKSGSTVIALTGYMYNARGLMTSLRTINTGSSTISNFGGPGGSAMFYDGIGNRTSMPATITASSLYSGTTNYSYDNISGTGTRSQLTQESSARNSGYTNNFAYDGGSYTATTGVGNPTTMRGSSVYYNVNNQITTNTYDGDGNPISYKANTVSFDPEDRMTAYGSAETNTYDGDHHRASIATSSGTSYYIFDGAHPFLTEDTTGTATKVVTWGLAGVALSHTTTSSFYTWDPQGNICQKLDSSGTVLYSRMYDAFGNVTKTDSDTDSYASFGGQWGYFFDSATGLEQLGHRFYDSATGRFVTRDPTSYHGGINLYSYVANNPNGFVDPSGEMRKPPLWAELLCGLHVAIFCHDVHKPGSMKIPTGVATQRRPGPTTTKKKKGGKKSNCPPDDEEDGSDWGDGGVATSAPPGIFPPGNGTTWGDGDSDGGVATPAPPGIFPPGNGTTWGDGDSDGGVATPAPPGIFPPGNGTTW